MQCSIKLIACAFLLFAIIPQGLCIKCWICLSTDTHLCEDPIDNSTLRLSDCVEERGLPVFPETRSFMCRKIKYEVKGGWQYIRDCSYVGEDGIQGDETCEKRNGTDNTVVHYCTCNSKDGCNSSFTFTPTKIVVYTLTAITAFKKYVF